MSIPMYVNDAVGARLSIRAGWYVNCGDAGDSFSVFVCNRLDRKQREAATRILGRSYLWGSGM